MSQPRWRGGRDAEFDSLHTRTQAPVHRIVRALVLLLLLFIGPLLGATYWMHVQAEREIERGELQRDLLRARTLAALVEREFASAQKILTSIADRPSFRHAWGERNFRALEPDLSKVRELEPAFLFVSVYEPDGTPRMILPQDPIVGQNLAYRAWYRGLTSNWEPYVLQRWLTRAGMPHSNS